jgi:hypothetical protein
MCKAAHRAVYAGIVLLAVVAAGGNPAGNQGPGEDVSPPLHFASPEEAVRTADRLLATQDWVTLARDYDLSLTPPVLRRVSLREGPP